MKAKINNKLVLSFIVMTAISGMALNAQDWSKWRGNNHDAVVKDASINLDWTKKRPALLWTFREAGSGYSSPVIVGTTLYMSGATDGSEFAFAMDAQTGNLKWKQAFGEKYVQDRGDGPRGTIAVDGDKLYLIHGAGLIYCLSATDGKILWHRDFVKDFDGKIMSKWGYSESPLVDGELVVCTPGGSKGTLVALDKNSGATVWLCKEWTDEAGYSSPIVAEVNGVRQYIQQSSKGVAGVSAKDGKLLWRVPINAYKVAVVPTPVYNDNIVYVTSGYNAGCTAIRLTKTGVQFKAETIYANKVMVNHHGGVVLVNGHIYGYSDPSGWVCQNLKSGAQIWSQKIKEVGKGAVLAINDRLLLFDERTGLLTVAAASPNGWKEFGRMELPERTEMPTMDNMTWTHPSIANGKLYLRDHDLLFCFDLRE